jgi:hypothetical protein
MVVLCAPVLIGGCASKAGDRATGATVPTGDATTTTATTDLSEAHLNDVLASLNHVYGDLIRKRLSTGRVDQEDLVPLRAIYNEPEFTEQAQVLVQTQVPDASEIRQPTGDRKMTVKELVSAKQDCVVLVVNYDFSAVRTNPPPVKDWYVTLQPTNPNADPTHVNPTPWSFGYDGDKPVTTCAG